MHPAGDHGHRLTDAEHLELRRQKEREGRAFIRPVISGRAFLTGFHTFLLDPDDPFPMGFRIGPRARAQ